MEYWLTKFLHSGVEIDLKNNTQRIIYVEEYSPGLPRKDLVKGLEDKIVIAYYHRMVNSSVKQGAKREYAEEELKEALEFEIKLANLTLPEEQRRDPTLIYNPMTLGELTGNYSYFPWKEYFNYQLPSGITVDDDQWIIVLNPKYFAEINKLVDSTSKRVQANIVMQKYGEGIIVNGINPSVREIQREYLTKQFSSSISKDKQQELCVVMVSALFPVVTGALYVREYFNKETKENVGNLVKNVHTQLIKMIDNASWLDNETQKNALDKAKAISRQIAYPDELLNDSIINDYEQKKLEAIGDDFITSLLSIILSSNKQEWSKLKQKVEDKNNWEFFARETSSVNAYYSPAENIMSKLEY